MPVNILHKLINRLRTRYNGFPKRFVFVKYIEYYMFVHLIGSLPVMTLCLIIYGVDCRLKVSMKYLTRFIFINYYILLYRIIYVLGLIGLLTIITSCFAICGVDCRLKGCIGCHSFLQSLILLFQAAFAVILITDKEWQKLLPDDQSGEFDMVRL